MAGGPGGCHEEEEEEEDCREEESGQGQGQAGLKEEAEKLRFREEESFSPCGRLLAFHRGKLCKASSTAEERL